MEWENVTNTISKCKDQSILQYKIVLGKNSCSLCNIDGMKLLYIYLLILAVSINPAIAQIDIEGHRGARGLAPENSIPGFIKALDLGVTTLEMDVVISGDGQVVVSHEGYFSSTICVDPKGVGIKKGEQKELKIFEMDYSEIKLYDCGSKQHNGFPDQSNEPTYKPLLSEAIKAIERHVKGTTGYLVNYNIEIKCFESGDNIYHPEVAEFSTLVYEIINTYLDLDRVIIQSFDFRVLRYWHEHHPKIRLAALVGSEPSIQKNLDKLGFTPAIYSPNHSLLNKEKIQQLHALGIKVVPWTVNSLKNMEELVEYGVDGLITDYPNRAKELGYTIDVPYGRK